MNEAQAPKSTAQARDADGKPYPPVHHPRANVPIPANHKRRAWQLGVVLSEKSMDYDFFRAVIGELVATTFFLFNTVTVVQLGRLTRTLEPAKHLIISLAFGFNIFLLVWMFAGVSGGNLNPAVSFCLMLGKHISVVRALCYIVAQCLGAVIGAALAKVVTNGRQFGNVYGAANVINPGFSEERVFLGEMILTMLLCLTVLVGTNGELWRLMSMVKISAQLPVALGVVVSIAHFVLIPIDSCSINPARSFGPAVVANQWESHWVYWVAPCSGAVLALLLWEVILRPPVNAKAARDDSSSQPADATEV